MNIAVPASSKDPKSPIDTRLGRAAYFLIFNDQNSTWEAVDNTQVLNAVQGAGIQASETLARHQVNAVLTGHCGPKAFRALQAAGVTVYIGVTGSVENAVQSLLAGSLKPAESADVDGHW